MAELCVRVVDKVNPDSIYLDAQCTKRGDVIEVREDGFPWGGPKGAANVSPEWRIIAVPGLDPSKLTGFLTPELDIDPKQPSKTLQRRGFKLDLDTLAQQKSEIAVALADGKRQTPIVTTVLTLDQLLALQVKKSPIPDPAIGAMELG